MTRYPIVYTYREVIVGNGYVAAVETTGRCLMEDFGNEDVWVTGVLPSGFSAGADDQQAAAEAFQREHRVALLDMVHEAPDFESFRTMVHEFHAQKSVIGQKEWWEAVAQVRAGEITSEWLEKVSADTEPKLKVQCISLGNSEEPLEHRVVPSPSLNPDEYQIRKLAA